MRRWVVVTLIIRGLISFRSGALTEKSQRYPLSFLFVEVNFSSILLNLKMAFSVAFNLISKFVSCPVAQTDIAGVGFIITIPERVLKQ